VSKEDILEKGFRITGRVQGVFYRAWTQATATELGLEGTVRNRRDGSVEAHVRGPSKAVEAFQARLWDGPPSASVKNVETLEPAEPGSSVDFQILPTA